MWFKPMSSVAILPALLSDKALDIGKEIDHQLFWIYCGRTRDRSSPSELKTG
jgi:hypothetical protein